MNPLPSLHVPLVRHSLRLDQGAHQQARLAYQIVSQVVNKRPEGPVKWCDGKVPIQNLGSFEGGGFSKNSFTCMLA